MAIHNLTFLPFSISSICKTSCEHFQSEIMAQSWPFSLLHFPSKVYLMQNTFLWQALQLLNIANVTLNLQRCLNSLAFWSQSSFCHSLNSSKIFLFLSLSRLFLHLREPVPRKVVLCLSPPVDTGWQWGIRPPTKFK